MRESSKGLVALLVCFLTWGLSPLFYRLLNHVPAGDVLAHRTIWSLVLFAGILGVQGRLSELRAALTSRHVGMIFAAALFVSANWGLYIWSVQNGHVVESSLGYYIFPLVAVLMGVVIFHEKLTPAQMLAVGLATLAVLVLTVGLGAAPWISLALAVTFGVYGVFKKMLPLGPVVSVAAEVALLTPFAVLWLILGPGAPTADHFGDGWAISLLLVASGVVTAVPLMLFSYGARRVGMTTVGLMQYLNPTLQFLCAVVVLGEHFTRWHMIAFSLIWIALAIYSGASIRQGRRLRDDAPHG